MKAINMQQTDQYYPHCHTVHALTKRVTRVSGVGFHFPSPGDLPSTGIKPSSPTFQADALASEPPGKPINFRSPQQI